MTGTQTALAVGGLGLAGVGGYLLVKRMGLSLGGSAGSATGWQAAMSYGNQVGPGPGNQPNGVYLLRTRFTAPRSGTYTLVWSADDGAQLALDGHAVGQVTLAQAQAAGGLVRQSLTVSAGTHTLTAWVVNNGLQTLSMRPNTGGSGGQALLNPTGLQLALQAPNGPVVVTSASAAGWDMLLCPITSPAGSAWSVGS